MPTKRFKMGHRRSHDHQSRPPRKTEQPVAHHHLEVGNEMEALSSVRKNDAISDPESALRAYGTQLAHATCVSCKTPLLPDSKAAAKVADGLTEVDASGFFSCQVCHTRTCIGCKMTPRSLRRPTQVSVCCSDSQLFCAWIWLCALETPYLADESVKRNSDDHAAEPAIPGASTPGLAYRKPNGTGYGGTNSYPSNPYMDHTDDDFPSPIHTPAQVRGRSRYQANTTKPNREKILFPRLFNALRSLLPGYFSSTAYDLMPSSLLCEILRRSRMMEVIATMLRTDSFEEIASNSEMFCTILDILARLVHHHGLVALVVGPRTLYPIEQGLLRTTLPIRHGNLPETRMPEEVTPIIQLLDRFVHATAKIRNQALRMKDEFIDPESQRLLSVCEHAEMVYRSVQRSMKATTFFNNLSSQEAEKPAPSLSQQMTAWHRDHCVDSIDDDIFKKDFHFTKERKCKDSPAKGRMKRLLTELATLQSALPEGIFVRYSNSRPDLMKVIILGPRDTPYERGIFEFDMVCPLNYPQASPKMHFKTTGKGTAHFNPNLYPDGKVCLSLLGTWSGPAWTPNQSTILQVLVSIQAMIFCSEPWYNEPGRESREMEDQSKRFNLEVQILTIRHALIDVLTQAAKDSSRGCWEEVIDKHFRTYGTEILKTLREWQKKAEKMPERANRRPHPMPPLPQQPFAAAHPTMSDAFPNTFPQPQFPTFGNAFSSIDMQPLFGQSQLPMYALHPHFATTPIKYSLGARFASLANLYQSPLVLPPVSGEIGYMVDAKIPQKFHDILQETATATGLPLVVPASQYTPWPPELALKPLPTDDFYSKIFQRLIAPDLQDPLDLSIALPGAPSPSAHLPPFSTLGTNIASTPKSYASAVSASPLPGNPKPQNQESSSLAKASLEQTTESDMSTEDLTSESSSSSFVPLPPLEPETWADHPVPKIPAHLMKNDHPTQLTEWLEPIVSYYQSLKMKQSPESPEYTILQMKQMDLLEKANSNKWNKTFTLTDFVDNAGFSDSDLDDDVSMYGPSQGKTGLQKEIEKYEKVLKDFLRAS